MGILHAGIINALPNSRVVAFCEKEGMLAKFARKLLPNCRFYFEVREMLAKEDQLDAIYVATPISSHLPIVEEIVASGKKIGVFMEKPLAGNYNDAMKIAELSSESGLKTMVGFQKRFSPIFQRGKEMLEKVVLGKLTSFSAYSYVSGVFSEGNGWRFKAGQGGALLDLGPHLVDLLLWYFGKAVSVEGSTKLIYSREVDDSAKGVLKFDSGLEGSFDVSWSIQGYRLPEIGIEVMGENGKLKITDDYLKLELFSDRSSMKAGKYHFKKPEFDMSVDFLIADPEYCIEDKYFIDCISGQKAMKPDFYSGAIVNDILEKVSHKPIEA